MAKDRKLISIIVPCLNEEEAIPIYYEHIIPILSKIDQDYELIFVDDGSTDNTAKLFKDYAAQNEHIKYIIFSRNFGKEAAMYAGLSKSKGDLVAVMDVDLQDPPEKLLEMYDYIENEGYDCVATRRVTRKGEPKIRSWFARKFYKLINKWSQTEVVDGARDFRLMTRKMVNTILSMKEYNRFSKGIFSFVGFKTKWLEYENIERCAGVTKWNFHKLFVYAIDGIVSFTLMPLYLIFRLGAAMFVLDFIAAIVLMILELCSIHVYTNLSILILVMVLLCSIVIMCLGIMSLYMAKTYMETKARPIYMEKENNID